MTNPFWIDGPALISFSGGRTSAYMLRRILDVGLQPDVHVLFANTGKERPETLDFVQACATAWNVPLVWIERAPLNGYRVVTSATANRDGEPYAQLLTERKSLPNPAQRWCTTELKSRPMGKWMVDQWIEHWDAVIGLRADEPQRVHDMRAAATRRSERWEPSFPLHDAGIRVADVMAFWQQQPFDLQLKPYEGNCDNCFLKHVNKRERIAKERPDLNTWWIEQEARKPGQFFRQDEPNYAMLPMLGNLFDVDSSSDDSGGVSCFCTD